MSSVDINKLHKAISDTSYICKNDNYLKQREISILYSRYRYYLWNDAYSVEKHEVFDEGLEIEVDEYLY